MSERPNDLLPNQAFMDRYYTLAAQLEALVARQELLALCIVETQAELGIMEIEIGAQAGPAPVPEFGPLQQWLAPVRLKSPLYEVHNSDGTTARFQTL